MYICGMAKKKKVEKKVYLSVDADGALTRAYEKKKLSNGRGGYETMSSFVERCLMDYFNERSDIGIRDRMKVVGDSDFGFD
jgi:hypothetical protein